MKLRFEICLLFWTFFFISLFYFSTTCYAIKFDFGVEKGDDLIWKCNIYNGEKLKNVLGKNWNENSSNNFNNIGQDKKMRWRVEEIIDDSKMYNTETNDYEEILVLEYNKWIWTKNDNWEEKEYECQYNYYANPKNYPEDYIFPEFAPLCVPIPFGDYLKKIDLYEGYSIDTRALYAITCEINKHDLEGDYPTEYVKIQAMYTNKGILTSYKLYLDDHQVILDITLENDSIFKFDNISPFIPIIIAVIYFGIVYFIYKKILKS
ncbi:MAG TPA: hypothetical protein VGB37_07495 [Candidatus Lokiarchaeia archaeon]